MRFLIALLFLSGSAFAATTDTFGNSQMDIEWDAPTQNIDGSPLTDLDAYIIYWKFQVAGDYTESFQIDDETATDAVIDVVVPGAVGETVTVYIAAKAVNAQGQQSVYSNEITRTFIIADGSIPMPPTNLRERIRVTFRADGENKMLVAVQ